MSFITLSLFEGGMVGILSALFLIQLLYLIFCHRFYRHATEQAEEKKPPPTFPPLSIVIASHNEAAQLRTQLPEILNQEYPDFEVIVINNTSTDDTEDVVASLRQQYPNLSYSFVPTSSRNPSNKKVALAIGMKASRHEWIVFTEPGYLPLSPYWLQHMARNFSPQTGVVLGYSRYKKKKGCFATQIRLLDFLTQLRFLASAATGHPFMGYGRNLVYRKSMFFKKQGYSGFLYMKRGEDDLFLNKVVKRSNTRVEVSPESVLELSTLPTPRQWMHEQQERKETYRLLSGSQPLFWQLETGSRILFLIVANGTLVYGLLFSQWIVAGIALLWLSIRFLLFFFFTNRVCRVLQEPPFGTSLLFFSGIQLTHLLRSCKTKSLRKK